MAAGKAHSAKGILTYYSENDLHCLPYIVQGLATFSSGQRILLTLYYFGANAALE